MELWHAFLIALASLSVFNGGLRLLRRRRRRAGARLPDGDPEQRRAEGLPARIFSDRSLPGGPKAGGINRDRADLLLGQRTVVLSTGDGRILDLGPGLSAEARCVGPKRLVLEADHRSGRARLRVELLVDDAEGWARDIQARIRPA
jgi:hypothetical protein